MILRALIDQCSEGTLITSRAVRALGLRRTPVVTDVSGVGATSGTSTECVSFQLRSNLNPHFETFVPLAFVMDTVTSDLPSNQIEPQAWPHMDGLVLADPTYFKSNKIDLLIGTEMHASILLPDIRIGRRDHPIAQNSYFGWILYGQVAPAAPTVDPSATIRCHHTAISPHLETLVQRFFETEEIQEERARSEEEQWFIDFFNQHCIRQPTGKYMVRLPLKSHFDPN
ncbi:PREDICTED: uncharacterized protein LOC108368071 [Rhagoletis zephyria]|uniref:uncharacterized protein LOC108368071 n=1 Tax=Rhagoletis zephyria TaxID=28612 RepID=UPI000811257A|nr:PREDICTED: uncharacterized protein LOC108368071 [Rhagoletis zephyria]XP_036322151.1 uncharacterized protein LOC118736161 [Rhagoletis pomonella]